MIHQILPDFFRDAGTGRQKSGGNHHCRFAVVVERIDNVLQEHQIDGHAALILVWYIGYTGKEPLLICLASQFFPVVTKVHVEGRIADDIVKSGQAVLLGIQMAGCNQCIVVDHISQGMHQVVQDQVQPQKLVGLGGNILGVDGAVKQSHISEASKNGSAKTERSTFDWSAIIHSDWSGILWCFG